MGVVTYGFTVPDGVYYGNTTLRVQVQELANSMDPCEAFVYGGTKDFNITITRGPSVCESGPSDLSITLGDVTLRGETKDIVHKGGCSGVSGLQDLAADWGDLIIGNIYTLDYTVLHCSSDQISSISAAWVDFNGNNIFETWEQIVSYSSRSGLTSTIFKVPMSTLTEEVKIGRTILRVQAQRTSAAEIDPCSNSTTGATKDFALFIQESGY